MLDELRVFNGPQALHRGLRHRLLLARLSQALPARHLKIDRTFVRDVTIDIDDAAIVSSIIGLAHNLRLKVIAEGVESEEQLTYLREHGCDWVQGYYFSEPLTAEDFCELLKKGKPLFSVSARD
jgi:EAL domain-containing protein (putative c-di-GMP-specific phosphodiesterase class I)